MKKVLKLFFLISLIVVAPTSFADLTIENKVVKHDQIDTSPKAIITDNKPQSAISGNFDMTTNYIYRGVSNSNNLPAFQGGLTYTFLSSGLYLSIWGSNVYMPTNYYRTATVEVDAITGISNKLDENLNYDISLERYSYPKAQELSYNEVMAILTYYFLTATVAYTTNEFNTHVPGVYYNLALNYEIPCKWIWSTGVSIQTAVGHYALRRKTGRSYTDYSVTITKKFNDTYSGALEWTDTNHELSDDALDHSHAFITLSANF